MSASLNGTGTAFYYGGRAIQSEDYASIILSTASNIHAAKANMSLSSTTISIVWIPGRIHGIGQPSSTAGVRLHRATITLQY